MSDRQARSLFTLEQGRHSFYKECHYDNRTAVVALYGCRRSSSKSVFVLHTYQGHVANRSCAFLRAPILTGVDSIERSHRFMGRASSDPEDLSLFRVADSGAGHRRVAVTCNAVRDTQSQLQQVATTYDGLRCLR